MADTTPSSATVAPTLSIRDLTTSFRTFGGQVRAVDRVGFDVRAGEIVVVVGESGSGKSVTLLSAVGLLARNGRVEQGQSVFQGGDLLALPRRRLNTIRGSRIGFVFQDPMSALNPLMTVGAQIEEAVRAHQPRLGRHEVRQRVLDAMTEVGIPAPESRWGQYPHQFSGGMRQRIMIAMAVVNRPSLLIADEPTTALDVTVQAQILRLLVQLKTELGTSVVVVTHDFGVAAEIADRVVVMNGGRVVEIAPVDTLFHDARHHYTRALLASRPTLAVDGARLRSIDEQHCAGHGDLELVAGDHYVAPCIDRDDATAKLVNAARDTA